MYDRASVNRLVRFGAGRGEHIGEDRRLRCKEATIDAERYIPSEEDDIAVIEPELLVMFGWLLGILRGSKTL